MRCSQESASARLNRTGLKLSQIAAFFSSVSRELDAVWQLLARPDQAGQEIHEPLVPIVRFPHPVAVPQRAAAHGDVSAIAQDVVEVLAWPRLLDLGLAEMSNGVRYRQVIQLVILQYLPRPKD
jgi:hypothetical protein